MLRQFSIVLALVASIAFANELNLNGLNLFKSTDSSLTKNSEQKDTEAQLNSPSIGDFRRDGFAALADKTLPSVVSVIATKKLDSGAKSSTMIDDELRDFLDRFFPFGDIPGFRDEKPNKPQKEVSFGSGFIISADGYIITNYHVVEDADDLKIRLNDDSELHAKLIGSDELFDIAVLKADTRKRKLMYVGFGDSDKSKVGHWVMAVGNPFGLGGSASVGVISAIARDIHAGAYDNFIQTDAAINRGHSGGPLFNVDGDVIGINTAIISPSGGNVGIGFAIPSNVAVTIIDKLKHGEKINRGYIGVKAQVVGQDIADALGMEEPKGAIIIDVVKGGPAEEAGIKVGDLITAFNGKDVKNIRTLLRLVAQTNIGSVVPVKIIRKGEEKILKIKIGELPKVDQSPQGEHNKQQKDKYKAKNFKEIGMSVATITDEVIEQLSLPKNSKGVVITSVDVNSLAEAAGLKKNDIITQVNQIEVEDLKEFEEYLGKKKQVLFFITRGGNRLFVSVNLSKD